MCLCPFGEGRVTVCGWLFNVVILSVVLITLVGQGLYDVVLFRLARAVEFAAEYVGARRGASGRAVRRARRVDVERAPRTGAGPPCARRRRAAAPRRRRRPLTLRPRPPPPPRSTAWRVQAECLRLSRPRRRAAAAPA